jgi:hypothetical protein
MANPYDKNAVAVHLLKPKDSKDNDDTEFVIAQA